MLLQRVITVYGNLVLKTNNRKFGGRKMTKHDILENNREENQPENVN